MSKLRSGQLRNRARVSILSYGIHDNCVISNISTDDRKVKGEVQKKMIYLTVTTIDPETKKKKSEVELSWFKLDFTSDYLFSNIREMCVQLHGILSCYVSEEEAFEGMITLFDEYGFANFEEIESHKWKKKEIDSLILKLKELFYNIMKDHVGLESDLIRVKITTDNKGEYSNIPKFGKFTEPMVKTPTELQFSNYEHKNHSKGGITENGAANVDVMKSLG